MTRSSILVCSALALGGCATPALGAAHCPHPVLLGPVDRVGGHRAAPAPEGGKVSGEVVQIVVVSQNGGGAGASASATSEGTKKLGADIVERTGGHESRDVRVASVRAGGWVFGLGYFTLKQWARIDGHVVEVSRDR